MVKLFIDSASPEDISAAVRKHPIRGITTNPTLARKADVKNYERWGRNLCYAFPNFALSIEVFADEFSEMEKQARFISTWGENVHVKIPVMNTKAQPSAQLINRLAMDGIKVNVTAILSYAQIDVVMDALTDTPAIVSVFAGRIADTGRNPVGAISHAIAKKKYINTEVLWASPRQVLDVYTAGSLGCDIITCTPEILGKLALECRQLDEYSRDTVRMFYDDAQAAGFKF